MTDFYPKGPNQEKIYIAGEEVAKSEAAEKRKNVWIEYGGSCRSEGPIKSYISANASKKRKCVRNSCPLLPRRLRTYPTTTAFFASAADTTSSAAAAARIADRQQHLLAILELIKQALSQFSLFGIR